ncbi:hypothetical protein ACIQ7D_09285 [Streptomyces sp. NPDC096310]|uniref:hypothetical protein n=1 Tax=Streptomyces sp. NPDC096310 TaxID=3366082 RepID=UPI003814C063
MRPLPLLAAAATVVAVVVALVTAFVTLPLAPTAADGPGRSCGRVADPEFPITTELRGGPGAYRAGGAAGEWSLDLTNTTGAECRNLHPVVVLYDRDRALDVAHVKLEMADDQGRMRALPLERTDLDEIVGVPDDRAPGFTVEPHRTVTVRIRLAFTATARPNEISATAATVQRRGDGGDWVGASNTYRFAVAAPGDRGRDAARGAASASPVSVSTPAANGTSGGTSAGTASGVPAGTEAGAPTGDSAPVPRPEGATAGAGTAATAANRAAAATGATAPRGDLVGRVVAALALLAAAAVLALGVRRLRDHRT